MTPPTTAKPSLTDGCAASGHRVRCLKRAFEFPILLNFLYSPDLTAEEANQMHTPVWFWFLIASLGGPDISEEAVEARFAQLSDAELIAVERHVREQVKRLGTAEVYAALRLAAGGSLSDDGFEYLRYWLVFQGEQHVTEVLANPDHLAEFVAPPCFEYLHDWRSLGERFGYAVHSEWEKRGRDIEHLESGAGLWRGEDAVDFDWTEAIKMPFPKIAKKCHLGTCQRLRFWLLSKIHPD